MIYYPFDETDGVKIEDYSSKMRHAEAFDLNLDIPGKFGSAVDFESIDPEHATINFFEANDLSINSTAWTISTWFDGELVRLDDYLSYRHALTFSVSSSFLAFEKSSPKRLLLFDGSDRFTDTI